MYDKLIKLSDFLETLDLREESNDLENIIASLVALDEEIFKEEMENEKEANKPV
jgi:hypothetical protein